MAVVTVGETITLRHSVQDYETSDAAVPYAAFQITTSDGRLVVVSPIYPDGISPSSYDAEGPMGVADTLNWRLDWTVGDTLEVNDGKGVETIPAAGETLTVVVYYLDGNPETDGIATFGFELNLIGIEGGT
jgi:hypothetical protein